jgi:hypothetical protein
MTIKESITKRLGDLNKLADSVGISDHTLANKWHEFAYKTLSASVSA